MELLDIVDERGIPTGKTIDRDAAHRDGIRHRTSHVWLIRNHEGSFQVLLQKRSDTKDSFPGCYDISSAGHIPAGVDFLPSALRELNEELGLVATPEDLHLCGQRAFSFARTFQGKYFRDNQISNVYCLICDLDADAFTLQQEEVSEVRWFDFDDCLNAVQKKRIPHCIYEEELQIVFEAANRIL